MVLQCTRNIKHLQRPCWASEKIKYQWIKIRLNFSFRIRNQGRERKGFGIATWLKTLSYVLNQSMSVTSMHRLIKYFQCHGRYCLQENTFFSFIRFTIIKLAKIKYSSQELQDMWNIVQNFNWKMLKLKPLKTWEPNWVSTLSGVPAILSVDIGYFQ